MGKVMDGLTATAIENRINQLFRLKGEQITERLFEGCDSMDGYEQVYARGIRNSMIISVELAVELVVNTLISLGIIGEADEKTIRKSLMSVVKTENVQQGQSGIEK